MTFCHYPKFTIVQADQLYLVEADDIWVISKGAILDKLLHKSGANVDTFFLLNYVVVSFPIYFLLINKDVYILKIKKI